MGIRPHRRTGTRLSLLLLATLGGLAAGGQTAGAADSTNYGIRPAHAADRFEVELVPGAATAQSAIVSNRSATAITFKIYPADALTTDQGGFALAARGEPQTGIGQWTTLPFDTITIGAGTQTEVPFQLTVPADAAPGDYAGGIVLEAPPRPGTTGEVADQTAVRLDIVERVGVRIYLDVAGTARPDLTVGRLGSTHEGGAIVLTLPITNTGNVTLAPLMAATVTGRIGGAAELDVRQVELLLPGQSTTVRATWSQAPRLVWGQVEAVVQFEGGTATARTDLRRVPWGPAALLTAGTVLSIWLGVRAVQTVHEARRIIRGQPPFVPRPRHGSHRSPIGAQVPTQTVVRMAPDDAPRSWQRH